MPVSASSSSVEVAAAAVRGTAAAVDPVVVLLLLWLLLLQRLLLRRGLRLLELAEVSGRSGRREDRDVSPRVCEELGAEAWEKEEEGLGRIRGT